MILLFHKNYLAYSSWTTYGDYFFNKYIDDGHVTLDWGVEVEFD